MTEQDDNKPLNAAEQFMEETFDRFVELVRENNKKPVKEIDEKIEQFKIEASAKAKKLAAEIAGERSKKKEQMENLIGQVVTDQEGIKYLATSMRQKTISTYFL